MLREDRHDTTASFVEKRICHSEHMPNLTAKLEIAALNRLLILICHDEPTSFGLRFDK